MSLLRKAASAAGSLVRVLMGAGAAVLLIFGLKEKTTRGPRRKPGSTS
jgi:hypothetical protein